MGYLVTGSAGFVGFHLCRRLLEQGEEVIGYDNLNPYYDVDLKRDRHRTLEGLGRFSAVEADLCDTGALEEVFSGGRVQRVCHLAAQVGVRFSIKNPGEYMRSNLAGFFNMLECCRKHRIPRLVYASSSSVYGGSREIPFSESQMVDTPISFYAATKKSNELMAHAYSHIFGLQTVGLRLFTVYGPWGRPDMAVWLFTEAILRGEPIRIFNHGRLKRDFTYVDDVVDGILAALNADGLGPYEVFNLGRGCPVPVLDLIETLEEILGRKALRKMQPHQAGDMLETFASINRAAERLGYDPRTSLEDGLRAFVNWYTDYYKIGK